MNNFLDVLFAIENNLSDVYHAYSKWYAVDSAVPINLKISKPTPFDSYGDIVARVTLYFGNEVVWDTLITYNTDLNRFCEKVKKKIETLKIKGAFTNEA
jgi:hypothetical protein